MIFPQTANEGDIFFQQGKYFIFENNTWNCFSKIQMILKLKLPVYINLLSAYKLKNNSFDIDINVSKELQLFRYREARLPLLQKLDIEYMKADENGNVELKQHIASKKQELRDITTIVLPDTLEELNGFWPEILN